MPLRAHPQPASPNQVPEHTDASGGSAICQETSTTENMLQCLANIQLHFYWHTHYHHACTPYVAHGFITFG